MANLKLKLDKAEFDGLEEGFKGLYTEKDGVYTLGVDGIEDTSGLKSALDSERKAHKQAEQTAKAWEKLGKTPEEILALIAKSDDDEKKRLEGKGEWEKLKEQLNTSHAQAIAEKDKELAGKDQAIDRLVVDSQVTAAIAKNEGNTVLLLPHVKSRCKVVNDNGNYSVQVIAEDGKTPLLDTKGNPISVDDFVKSLRENEIFQACFKPTGASGGGAKGSDGGGGKPFTITAKDATDNRKYRAAKEAAEKAGVDLEIVD